MRLSKKGAAFIAHFEGFKSSAYKCPSRVLTIGIGFTNRSIVFRNYWMKTRGHRLKQGDTITRQEALDILPMIVDENYGQVVRKYIQPEHQHHYDAAVSMCFNCGRGAAKWRWGKALASGDIERAAQLLSVTAVTSKGRKLKGLIRRRKAEAKLLQFGDYGPIAKISHSKAVTLDRSIEDRTESSDFKPSSCQTDVDIPHSGGYRQQALQYGRSGPEVRILQTWLDQVGYPVGFIDGIFGSLTRQALLAFEADHDFALDGRIEMRDKTWIKLAQMVERGEKRQLSEERHSATQIENSRIMEASEKGASIGVLGSIGATITTFVTQFNEFKYAISEGLQSVLGTILTPSTLTILTLCLTCLYMTYQHLKARFARLDDHREARNL